jgi:hypothetical protein
MLTVTLRRRDGHPGINNLSKHNRSKDNAAQIGLYAPKHIGTAAVDIFRISRPSEPVRHPECVR